MVTMRSLALRLPTGMEHERRTSPFTCTEHEPHCATPHPYLVPVSPSCSRNTQRSGVSASTSTSRPLPFTFTLAISPPPFPISRLRLHPLAPPLPPHHLAPLPLVRY